MTEMTYTRRPDLALVHVTGDDRATWLQGLVTQGLVDLPDGGSRYGTVINLKGRVLTDFQVGNDGASLWLELPSERVVPIIEHLEGRLITEDAGLQPRPDLAVVTLQGPGVVSISSGPACHWTSIGGSRCLVLERSHTGLPARDLIVPTDALEPVLEALGAVEQSQDALEAQRVAHGVPRYGADFDDAVFPLEAGLQDAIHWGKGCYLGQEVLARLAHRGHTNKELRILDAEALPAPGDEVWPAEGGTRAVGRVTSATRTADGVRVLAYVRRKHFAAGTTLQLRKTDDDSTTIAATVSADRVRGHVSLAPENDPDFQGKGNKVHRALV